MGVPVVVKRNPHRASADWRCQNCGRTQDAGHRYEGRCQACHSYMKRTGQERPPELWKRYGVESLFTVEERVVLRDGIRQKYSVASSNYEALPPSDPARPHYLQTMQFLSNLLRRL